MGNEGNKIVDSHSTGNVTRRSFLKTGALAAGVTAQIAGCGRKQPAAGDGSAAATGARLTYYLSNPTCIDPYNKADVAGDIVAKQLFDNLTYYDYQKEELTPLAAESWESNDDATEFTFHIAKGNTFHNGDPVDAQSFKRGWERVCDPSTNDDPSVQASYYQVIEGYDAMQSGDAKELSGVTCPDDYTLVVKLTIPFGDFPLITSIASSAPVPQAALDDPAAYGKAPIGNGPFMMDGEWEDGQSINLLRFEDYKGDKPLISGVTFSIQKDMETGYREFQGGNIDICDVPVSAIESARGEMEESEDGYTLGDDDKRLAFGDMPGIYFLAVVDTDPVLQDVNLRRAISLAIDREAICETIYQGTRVPADDILPKSMPGYKENAWEYSHYDADAAKELLDQYYPADADGKRGIELKLAFNGDGDHKPIMEAVQASLEKVGIDCELDMMDWGALNDAWDAKDYQISRFGWQAAYPSPDNIIEQLFKTGNFNNCFNYSNPDVDAAIDAARAIPDDEERIAAYQEIDKMVQADMPVIPLMSYKLSKAASTRVKHAYICPSEATRMTDWVVED